MSNITLIFPRFEYPSGDFSLGLAYLSSYLKHKHQGIKIDLIDTTFNPDMKYVSARLNESRPDIVGIYINTLMYANAMKVAQIAKANSTFVVAGGPHTSILPDTVIREKCIDLVCLGEGEVSFSNAVKEFYGNKNFDNIPGTWYRKNGTIIKNAPGPLIEDLDSLPFPDMSLYDVEAYIENFIQLDSYKSNLRGLSTIVSRGCPFQCSYCQPTLNTIFGRKFRIRSPLNVITELKMLKTKYNLDAVYFQDDTLTVSKKWCLEFCEAAISENLGMVWACNTRADTLDFSVMKRMKEAGLVKLKVGIESACDRIRNKLYRKGVAISQVDRLIAEANDLGIQVAGFFMLGAPTETKKEIFRTIKFAIQSDLKEANFSITVPLPGTGLFEMARKKRWNIPEKFTDFNYYHVRRPPFASSDVPSKHLELYKKLAYILFYFHPKRILHSLKTLCERKSFKKNIQKFKRF